MSSEINRLLLLANIQQTYKPVIPQTLIVESFSFYSDLLLSEQLLLQELEVNVIRPIVEFDKYLVEQKLSPTEIEDIFNQVEKELTSSSNDEKSLLNNRTTVGKAKDMYNKVKSVIEGEKWGFVKNFDLAVEKSYKELLAKGKKGEFDSKFQEVTYNTITKWKKMGKKYPLIQGIIWAIITILVGVVASGGSAAIVLGILKFTDRLLMGERFSSAVLKGIFTGGTAFLIQNITQMMKDYFEKPVGLFVKENPQVCKGIIQNANTISQQIPATNTAGNVSTIICHPDPNTAVGHGASFKEAFAVAREKLGANHVFKWHEGYYTTNISGTNMPSTDPKTILGSLAEKTFKEIKKMGDTTFGGHDLGTMTAAELKGLTESVDEFVPKDLILEQVFFEGLFGKIETKLKDIGKNLTNKVTVSKMQKAWSDKGSPREYLNLKKFLLEYLISVVGNSLEIHKILDKIMPEETNGKETDSGDKKEDGKEDWETKLDQLDSIAADNKKEKEGADKEGADKEGADKEGADKESKTSDSADKESKTSDSADKETESESSSDSEIDYSKLSPEQKGIIKAIWYNIINNRPEAFNKIMGNPDNLGIFKSFVRDSIKKLKIKINLHENLEQNFAEIQNERIRTLAGLSTNRDYTMLVDYINSVLKD